MTEKESKMPIHAMSFPADVMKDLGLEGCTVSTRNSNSTYVTDVGIHLSVQEKGQATDQWGYARSRGAFYLCELPGCCGALVFHHMSPDQTKKAGSRYESVIALAEECARQNETPFLAYSARSTDEKCAALRAAGYQEMPFITNHYGGSTHMIYFWKMVPATRPKPEKAEPVPQDPIPVPKKGTLYEELAEVPPMEAPKPRCRRKEP